MEYNIKYEITPPVFTCRKCRKIEEGWRRTSKNLCFNCRWIERVIMQEELKINKGLRGKNIKLNWKVVNS